MFLLFVTFLAGLLSILTPCVLPLLPLLLAASADGGRRRPWGIVVGIVGTFALAFLVFTAAIRALGLPPGTLNGLAVFVLVIFGLILIVPRFEHLFQRAVQGIVNRAPQVGRGKDGEQSDGFLSGLAVGSTLGLVWTPCAGPILATISVASATESFSAATVLRVVAYALGMAIPLIAIAFGGRVAAMRIRGRLGSGRAVPVTMGVIMIGTAALIGTGQINKINRFAAENIGFSSTPIAALERNALEGDRKVIRMAPASSDDIDLSPATLEADGYPAFDDLADLGPAPEFEGISKWFNTANGKPLTQEDLAGKVVLVDVWTYSCINCIRTLPHLRKWHDKYADEGLIIVGLHAPEFEFEKDPGNVRTAIGDFNIEYPVALDNDFTTWSKYYNRFWPAKYLIDREGTIRYAHYGEGSYDLTEAHIRTLLGMDGSAPEEASFGEAPAADSNLPRTPETYLGYERADRFVGVARGQGAPGFVPDTKAAYSPIGTAGLESDQWSYAGEWTVEDERAIAGRGAQILIHLNAKDVHLVAGPTGDVQRGTLGVDVSGEKRREVSVDTHQLYTLRADKKYVSSTMVIDVSPGLAVHAFTFG